MNMRLFAPALAVAFAFSAVPAGAALTWVPYAAPDAGFTASFPGTPTVAKHPSDATVDGLYRIYEFDTNSAAYTVTVFRYKPGIAPDATPATFRGLRDSYAQGSGCKVASTANRTVAGSPGLESVCVDKKGGIEHLIDITLSGDELAMIVAAGPLGFAKTPSAIAFRNSFAFAPVVAPSPTPVPVASAMPPQPTATP